MIDILRDNKDKIRMVTDATSEQIYELLASAQCLVSPSLYEGFGIPPLEAMSLGTPVILSDIPVYKEVYSEYPVTFFRAGDADDLFQKLKNLPSAPVDVDELTSRTYTYKKAAETIMRELADRVPDNGISSAVS